MKALEKLKGIFKLGGTQVMAVDADTTGAHLVEIQREAVSGTPPEPPAPTVDPAAPSKRPKHWAYTPKAGTVWSPLKAWPVNEACWCGSTKKAKKCCLPKAQPTLSTTAAKNFQEMMDKGIYGRALIRRAFIQNAAEVAKTQPEGMTIDSKVEAPARPEPPPLQGRNSDGML